MERMASCSMKIWRAHACKAVLICAGRHTKTPIFPSAGASVEGNKASHDYWCGMAWHGSHGDQLHLDELTR